MERLIFCHISSQILHHQEDDNISLLFYYTYDMNITQVKQTFHQVSSLGVRWTFSHKKNHRSEERFLYISLHDTCMHRLERRMFHYI